MVQGEDGLACVVSSEVKEAAVLGQVAWIIYPCSDGYLCQTYSRGWDANIVRRAAIILRHQSTLSTQGRLHGFRFVGAVLGIVHTLQGIVVDGVLATVVVDETGIHDLASYDVVFNCSSRVLFTTEHHIPVEVLVLGVGFPAEFDSAYTRLSFQSRRNGGSHTFAGRIDG